MRCIDDVKGKIISIILAFLAELKIEALGEHGASHFEDQLCKSFAETDALSSIEGQPAMLRSLLAIRSQGVWMCGVEAIWIELFRILPVLGAEVQVIDVDDHGVVGLYYNVSNLGVLLNMDMSGMRGWWIDAKSLIDNLG